MRDGYAVVESEQRDVVVEVEEAEGARNGPQHETRFRSLLVVAAVMFSECDLDHEPHEPETDRHVGYPSDHLFLLPSSAIKTLSG